MVLEGDPKGLKNNWISGSFQTFIGMPEDDNKIECHSRNEFGPDVFFLPFVSGTLPVVGNPRGL
ncbi:MAG: hypothetical protein A2252_05685 [Elusimicrobia bacterium RIFOXYA2_FULL_39_19]|nr:MAG: hypothetical protein A2252_05685 [Elusimicrobia bacterium RIFOXYA2_FULL_39_19]